MGPLVPEIISNNLNFIVALVVGILFGAILEQAGFSTSKKLVGLFYGYDFTVLRVFFTAGVTAMLGVVAFNHFGILDASLIYVNPLFVKSAIVGGLIMGLGFVVGGFCPGTSVCAAAIGKIDAIIFIAGSFVGVLIFAEGYSFFEPLYKADFLGFPRAWETLGISQALFAILMTLMAVGSFVFVTIVEKRVNKIDGGKLRLKPVYTAGAVVLLAIAVSSFAMPDRRESLLAKSQDPEFVASKNIGRMSPDELAFWLIDGNTRMTILDLRTEKEFAAMQLPRSKNIKLSDLMDKDIDKTLGKRSMTAVIISNTEAPETRAAAIAMELGYKNVKILQGGLNNFKKAVLNFDGTKALADGKLTDQERFRKDAAAQLPAILAKAKSGSGKKEKPKRIIGGC
ncbi:MAG: DUF6691 family protein [Chloroflexota bacterium]